MPNLNTSSIDEYLAKVDEAEEQLAEAQERYGEACDKALKEIERVEGQSATGLST